MTDLVERVLIDFVQMTDFAKDPLVLEEGNGVRIKDTNGNWYIDGLSGVFVTCLGHGNRAIIDAIVEQLNTLAFGAPLYTTNTKALELAKNLLEVAPAGLTSVKFLSGGSEVTEAAMKMARQYHRQTGSPGRYKIVSRYGSYHGGTFGAMSASGSGERKKPYEPMPPGFLHVHPPYCYRCPFDKTFGSCGITCATLIERTIEREDADTIAAIIAEPVVVSGGGFIVPPDEYLPMLRDICDRHGILLIFDEIITGFGRLGHIFGSTKFGVTPDLLCVGKGMSGGYAPLSAVLIHEKVAASFGGDEGRQFMSGHTYGANPVACAAGVAALNEILGRKLVDQSAERGAQLRDGLDALARKHPTIGDVRGHGMLQGIEFVMDRSTKRQFPAGIKFGLQVAKECQKRGLLLRKDPNWLVLAPPFVCTAAEIEEIVSIIDVSISTVEQALGLVVRA